MEGGGSIEPGGRSFVRGQGDAMYLAHHLARENLQKAQMRQKKDYDLRVHQRKYGEGDVVYRFKRPRHKVAVPIGGEWEDRRLE